MPSDSTLTKGVGQVGRRIVDTEGKCISACSGIVERDGYLAKIGIF
jgi:hypothetical protein